MAIVGLTSLKSGNHNSFASKSSPTRFPWLMALQLAGAGAKMIGGMSARKKARKEQEVARTEMNKARQQYMNIDYVNPYEGLESPYSENVYEDLKVDTKSADYLKRQSEQQQANIMQGLQGAAGASGVAGLAQSMANIGARQAEKATVSISDQVRENQKLRLKGELAKKEGEYKVDMLKRKGETFKQSQEQARLENMYGLSIDRTSAAESGLAASQGLIRGGIGEGVSGITGLYGKGGARKGKEGDDWESLMSGIQSGASWIGDLLGGGGVTK